MRFGLRHIRYFIAVAEELHFRRAAEKLGVAQPALSRAIHYLERELEVRLFNRSNRSVEITSAGFTFLQGCRSVLNSVEHAVENARWVHDGQLGSVRIGYTDMAIAGVLPSILKKFHEQQQRIILQLHHDVTITQMQKLDEDELDVGFVTGPINRFGYEQKLIQSERFVCVVYENHPLAKCDGVKLEELAQENFVHGISKDWKQFYSYLLPLCRRSGYIPKIVQEAFNTSGILGLVACGMGITILTESVRGSIASNLVVLPIVDVLEELQTVAIWKSDAIDGSKKLFIDYLHATTSDKPPEQLHAG